MYRIAHVEERGDVKQRTLENYKTRTNENGTERRDKKIEELRRTLEHELKERNDKRSVNNLRFVIGIFHNYFLMVEDESYEASCHGKWGKKPSSWPEYVIFVNPNNGTWNDETNKKEKAPKKVLEKMFEAYKRLYQEQKRNESIQPIDNGYETGRCCNEGGDEDWKTELFNKIQKLKENCFDQPDIVQQIEKIIKLFNFYQESPGFVYEITTMVYTVQPNKKQENWGNLKDACENILRKWSMDRKAMKRKIDADDSDAFKSNQLHVEPREDVKLCDSVCGDIVSQAMAINGMEINRSPHDGITAKNLHYDNDWPTYAISAKKAKPVLHDQPSISEQLNVKPRGDIQSCESMCATIVDMRSDCKRSDNWVTSPYMEMPGQKTAHLTPYVPCVAPLLTNTASQQVNGYSGDLNGASQGENVHVPCAAPLLTRTASQEVNGYFGDWDAASWEENVHVPCAAPSLTKTASQEVNEYFGDWNGASQGEQFHVPCVAPLLTKTASQEVNGYFGDRNGSSQGEIFHGTLHLDMYAARRSKNTSNVCSKRVNQTMNQSADNQEETESTLEALFLGYELRDLNDLFREDAAVSMNC